MARFVYAKIYCDLLRHPLLRSRPDSDVRLVVGLLLEAKEHAPDGLLRHLTAADAKELCHIKASVVKVQAGLDYLVAAGWLIARPENSFEIKDFVTRQAADSAAERMARWRDSRRDAKRDSTGDDSVTKRNAPVTSAFPDKEGEVDVEEKATASGGAVAPPAPTTAVWTAYSKAYEQRYGARPVRNAKVNGQLTQMLKRLAVDEAPAVAEFYVANANAFYVRSGHAIDLLLRDCEKLRTEWFTGHRITATEARQQDQTQANLEGWDQLRRGNGVVK